MQDQKMMDSSGGVVEALKWLEPFASGEYVALGIPREALLAIGAKQDKDGNVAEDTVYGIAVEDGCLMIRVLQEAEDFVCNGNCDTCPLNEVDCDGDCEDCPCCERCEESEVE